MKKTIAVIILLVIPLLVVTEVVALAFWVVLGALGAVSALALILTVAMAIAHPPAKDKH